MRLNRKFPNLTLYLQHLSNESARRSVTAVPAWTLLISVGLLVLGGTLGPWGFLGGAALGLALMGTVTAIANRAKAKDPHEQRRRDVFRTAAELRQLEVHHKLHRWMDPVALQLLEAGAYHWSRVRSSLTGPQWGAKQLPEYWQSLRNQVSVASDEGMSDLLLLARNCLGPPQKDKQSDIQGVIESFIDLDIADALQGLKQMASADWTAYAHQSPQAQMVAQHGREIAERLKALADDVESKAGEISMESSMPGELSSLEALDGVLGELRTVREAEEELQQRLGQ